MYGILDLPAFPLIQGRLPSVMVTPMHYLVHVPYLKAV